LSKKRSEYLVDTDVLIDHLVFDDEGADSYLESLMKNGICFTTVLNASELLYRAVSDIEKEIIIGLLSSLKIVGLHPRYSLKISLYKDYVVNVNDALMCVVADYNKLPIITINKQKYAETSLIIFHPADLYSS
jgi:predicted nucleic acid-binding protein